MKKMILWSNHHENIKAIYNDYKNDEEYKDLSDDYLYEQAENTNGYYLDDLRDEARQIKLNNDIICIADLGFWYGRRQGYTKIGRNCESVFYDDCDFLEWCIDNRGNLRADASHHDGTHHYLYRVFKDGITESQKDSLFGAIYQSPHSGLSQKAKNYISKYTKSLGKEFIEVYGV